MYLEESILMCDNLLRLLDSNNEDSALLGVEIFKNGGYNYFLDSNSELSYTAQEKILYSCGVIVSSVFIKQLDTLINLPFSKLLTLNIRIFARYRLNVEYREVLLYINQLFQNTSINEIWLYCSDRFVEEYKEKQVANKVYKCVWDENGCITLKRRLSDNFCGSPVWWDTKQG